MGREVIKQPNGLYAIVSSITDTFAMLDATQEEIEEYLLSDLLRQIESRKRFIADSFRAKANEAEFKDWKNAIKWQWYQSSRFDQGPHNDDDEDVWGLIRQIDPQADEIVKAAFDENGDWLEN